MSKAGSAKRRSEGQTRFRLRPNGLTLLTPDEGWWGQPVLKRNPFHEILYVVRGRLPVWLDGGWFDLAPLELVYLSPGLPHRTRGTGRMGLEFFVLQWDEPGGPNWRHRPRTFRDGSGRLLVLFRWMWDLVHVGGEIRPLLDALLRAVVLGSVAGGPVCPNTPSQRVALFMRANLAGKVTLANMADVAGMGREHLIRVFASEMGVTPGRYLRRLRIEKAANLIRTTRMPLKHIAKECGFSSASYLSKVMMQHVEGGSRDVRRGCARLRQH
jgi:AraC-like DNA-binding protein/mannose-6-phosphate isomerase-like protein (cupin superfamily)